MSEHEYLDQIDGGPIGKPVDRIIKACGGNYHAVLNKWGDVSYPRRRTYIPYEEVKVRVPKTLPKVSWRAVKDSGDIRMTPYKVVTKRVYRSLGRIPFYYGSAQQFLYRCRDGNFEGSRAPEFSGRCVIHQGDLKYYVQTRKLPIFQADVEADAHGDIVQDVLTRVVTDNLSSFDLLTELVEFKDTLETVKEALKTARHPLERFSQWKANFTRRRRSTTEKSVTEIADRWLQYRYELMPLILSIIDAISTIAEARTVYKTSRASHTYSSSNLVTIPDHIESELFLLRVDRRDGVIRGTGKARFDFDGFLNLRLVDQLTVNPFTTAWEIIPFSFVVDWFVNIGDWLTSQTAFLQDVASQRKFCLSDRYKSSTDFYLVDRRKHEFPYRDKVDGSVRHVTVAGPNKAMQLIESRIDDGYERWLAEPSDVEFSINVSLDLSWQRWLDAMALSLKPLISGLRSLRT